MLVTKKSILTGIEHTLEIDVTEAQLAAHKAGANIQSVCGHLEAPIREFLISGITPEEWDQYFGDEEDEEG